MEENLIGYLLESLDPDSHREVADRLAAQNLPALTEAEVETEIQAARLQRRVAG